MHIKICCLLTAVAGSFALNGSVEPHILPSETTKEPPITNKTKLVPQGRSEAKRKNTLENELQMAQQEAGVDEKTRDEKRSVTLWERFPEKELNDEKNELQENKQLFQNSRPTPHKRKRYRKKHHSKLILLRFPKKKYKTHYNSDEIKQSSLRKDDPGALRNHFEHHKASYRLQKKGYGNNYFARVRFSRKKKNNKHKKPPKFVATRG